MTVLLQAEALEAFYGPSRVLKGLAFLIGEGEQIAVIGRNGMGKTTLIRSLIGLVPRRQGTLLLRKRSIIKSSPEEIGRRGVALVPEGRGIFGTLSVTENLLMAHRAGPSGRRNWTLARIFSLFPRLEQRRHHGGHQLSGGEQQMLAIARALMTNPDLILIDEATEGLAPLIAKEIWQTLEGIGREGIAAVIVDKDFRSLSRVASQIIVLSKGEAVFKGTPEDLRLRPDILERHLGI